MTIITPFKMYYKAFFIIFFAVFFAVNSSAQEIPSVIATKPEVNHPVAFIQNKGQWNESAKFLAQNRNLDVWLTSNGVIYDMYALENPLISDSSISPFHRQTLGKRYGHVVEMNFSGSNPLGNFVEIGESPTKYNYFMGGDSTKWATDVPLFESVSRRNLYENIDARFYFDGRETRYDLIVKPKGNPKNIRMTFDSTVSVSSNGTELSVATSLGVLAQSGLAAYQIIDNQKIDIQVSFVVAKNSVTFELQNYNKDYDLIIDPLVYSTYIGGSTDEEGYGIAIDGNRNAYITGVTTSSNFPTVVGSYNTIKSGGIDIFVSKLNAGGSVLLFSTFVGGAYEDLGEAIALDGSGNPYVTGYTASLDFPRVSAYQNVFKGGTYDAFLFKLSRTGNSLSFSTYIGGNNIDQAYAIAVDGSGNAYITGTSYSNDYPTLTPYNAEFSGAYDVILSKFSSSGGLLYSTYIGGNGGDEGRSIAVDAAGEIYVAGNTTYITTTPLFPITSPTFGSTMGGGFDGFVLKIDPSLPPIQQLIYSGLLAGSGQDKAFGIALDASNNAYITGSTLSSNFPHLGNPYKNSIDGQDGFITKINPTGSQILYSTFFGGTNTDELRAIAVDNLNNIYVTGYSSSSNYPTTANIFFGQSLSGSNDAVLSKLNISSTPQLLYSSYIGGVGTDNGYGIALDADGNVYITGSTQSGNFPYTSGAADTTFNGNTDVFVTKLGTASPQILIQIPTASVSWCAGSTGNQIKWTSISITYVKIEISSNAGSTWTTLIGQVPAADGVWLWNIPPTYPAGTQYRIRVSNYDNIAVSSASISNFTIQVSPIITLSPTPLDTCKGTTVKFYATATGLPAPTMKWQISNGTNGTWSDIPGQTSSPLTLTNIQLVQNNTRYRAIFSNSCNAFAPSDSVLLLVRSQPNITQQPTTQTVCLGGDAAFQVASDQTNVTYQWFGPSGIINGATGSQLNLTKVKSNDAGVYYAVVSGSCKPDASSNSVNLIIQDFPAVLSQPFFLPVQCPGGIYVTTFTIRNLGPYAITLKKATVDNPVFTVIYPAGDTLIPPATNKEVRVRYAPGKSGTENAAITFKVLPCDLDLTINIGARMDSIALTVPDLTFPPMYQCDSTIQQEIVIQNTGDVKLDITDSTFSDPEFTIISPTLPFSLLPTATQKVVIRFSRNGIPNPNLLATMTLKAKQCGLQGIGHIRAAKITLDYKPSVDFHDFGLIKACESASKPFDIYLTNFGDDSVHITKAIFSNPAFSLVSPTGEFTIPKKPGSQKITVQFNGIFPGITSGTLTFLNKYCQVFGRGISLQATRADLTLTPNISSADFGSLLNCDSPRDTVVTIYNHTQDTSFINDAKINLPFSVVSPTFPQKILPKDSLKISIHYAPSADNTYSEQLNLPFTSGQCSDTIRIALNGKRSSPSMLSTPSKIDTLLVGACDSFRDSVIILKNTGTADITIDSVKIDPAFKISLPITVKAGENYNLTVHFEPKAKSVVADSIRLFGNPCNFKLFIPVLGAKQGISHVLSADTINFGTIYSCDSKQTRSSNATLQLLSTLPGLAVSTVANFTFLPNGAIFTTSLVKNSVLSQNSPLAFVVNFAPSSDGKFVADMEIDMTLCGTQKHLILVGERKSTSVSGISGEILMQAISGVKTTKQVVIHNNGSVPAHCDSLAKIFAPFRIILPTKPLIPADIAPNDSLVVDVEYTGQSGNQFDTLKAYFSTPCLVSAGNVLHGTALTSPTTTLGAFPTIDFGDVLINTPKDTILPVKNTGLISALISSSVISGANLTDFSKIKELPDSILTTKSDSMKLRFLPTSLGAKTATLTINYNGSPLQIFLVGNSMDNSIKTAKIYLPDTTVKVATIVRLPLRITPGANFTTSVADSFFVRLHWNSTVLNSVSVENAVLSQTILAGEQVLILSGKLISGGELCAINGEVLLGTEQTTKLVIDSVWWNRNNSLIQITKQDGSLTLENTCKVAGRLVSLGGNFGITAIVPNPTFGATEILVETVENGTHELEIFDVSGKSVWKREWTPPNIVVGSPSRLETFSVSPEQLPVGIYIVVLKAPSRSGTAKLMIGK